MNRFEISAMHWNDYANRFPINHEMARLARRTVVSLFLEAEDGVPRCACHLLTRRECDLAEESE